jgi:hypothetical protein
VTLSVDAMKELRVLARLTPDAPAMALEDEKKPLYRSGYANGYADCLREVLEIVEADE